MSAGRPPPRPGDPPGSQRYLNGSFVGELFPSWGDPKGTSGQLTVLRITPAKGEFLPKDPFIINKAIKNYLGGADIEGGFSESNNDFYALKIRNNQHTADLRKMTQFCGVNVTITDHPVHNFTRSVVTCQDVKHYSDEKLLEELMEQGITAVRQFTKKVNGVLVPTGSMLVTCSGSVRPSHVHFGYFRASTRVYYPSPMLCYGCHEFGHTKTRCPSKSPICGTCSGDHPVVQDTPCTRNIYCKRCQSTEHSLSSRKCPIYQIEDKIQHLRTDHNLSYPAAKKLYEQENPSITTAAVVRNSNDEKLENLSSKLDTLIAELKRKDDRIAELTAENRKIQEETKKQNEDLKRENQILQNTIKNLNNTLLKLTASPCDPQHFEDQQPPQTQKLTKKQLKTIRKRQEAEARSNNEIAPEIDGFTAGHNKLQRTGSTSNKPIIYEVTIGSGSQENPEVLPENDFSMDHDQTISSEEEDPADKEL